VARDARHLSHSDELATGFNVSIRQASTTGLSSPRRSGADDRSQRMFTLSNAARPAERYGAVLRPFLAIDRHHLSTRTTGAYRLPDFPLIRHCNLESTASQKNGPIRRAFDKVEIVGMIVRT